MGISQQMLSSESSAEQRISSQGHGLLDGSHTGHTYFHALDLLTTIQLRIYSEIQMPTLQDLLSVQRGQADYTHLQIAYSAQ